MVTLRQVGVVDLGVRVEATSCMFKEFVCVAPEIKNMGSGTCKTCALLLEPHPCSRFIVVV